MLFKARDIIGCAIDACDGEVGRVKDVYFDDVSWRVRYFVVETGSWLSSQEVLLVPTALTGGAPALGKLSTGLTRQQVKDSPPVSSDMPLSRQYEQRLHDHYGWLPYWDMPLFSAPGLYVYPPIGGLGPYPFAPEPPVEGGDELAGFREAELRRQESADPHLRSFREVKGYHIETRDGMIGHVSDGLVDPHAWRVSHLVIDTRNWLPGRQVVVDAGLVTDVDWSGSKVVVAMTRTDVEAAPELDPVRLTDESYARMLASHYGGIARARPGRQNLSGMPMNPSPS